MNIKNFKIIKTAISFFCLAIIFVFTNNAFGQESGQNLQVANFSIGKYGANNYEHFSFQVKDGKRDEISYSYKNRDKDLPLTYLGKTTDNKGFKVGFANKTVLQIYVVGYKLKVIDETTKKVKMFRWEYEGPVNGIGTACTICVGEDKEASMFVKQNFILK